MAGPPVLWRPTPDALDTTRLGAFLRHLCDDRGRCFEGYDDLWAWSVDDLDGFWGAVADWFDVAWRTPPTAVLASDAMPGAQWFVGGRLSYAEHALRAVAAHAEDHVVVVSRSQTRGPSELTAGELLDQVARCRAGLQELGVGAGDAVAAYLPNIAEAIVAFLATASLGAVWSSCGPEFGARAVVDRMAQIEPVVLFASTGYRYGPATVRRDAELAEIRAGLPSLRATVVVPYLDEERPDGATLWDELLEARPAVDEPPVAVAFDHPLYVLYSSGTTGLPKPIVHGHGGILLEHLKVLAFHHDLGPGDRFFWFTTTGWMMWNYLVSGLLVGATVVLFDGNPGHPDLDEMWRLVEETETTWFGTSAPFLLACRKAGVSPRHVADLHRLRGLGSTGAPLPPEGFRWAYEHVSDDVMLSSVSGGTDVCSALVGGNPLVPVWEGEISRPCLGVKAEAYSEDGTPVVGVEGELVVTRPMPSMPVGFWNDPDGERYRAAYFEAFPGVWHHGDLVTFTSRGTCLVTGRSDATLNRGGVRLGTSEFYSVVEAVPDVADSLVVHLDDRSGGPGSLLLFVVAPDGLDDALVARIRQGLRQELSPRHVPDEIHAVPAIPRTLSGKRLEVPVKRILTGTPAGQAAARTSLTDPEALDWFARFAQRR